MDCRLASTILSVREVWGPTSDVALHTLPPSSAGALSVARVLPTIWRSKEYRVVGVSLDVFLQILRPFESLAAEVTFVRLQGDVDSDVRGDMVALHGGGSARVPSTGEVEVVGALSANMLLADVLLTRRVSVKSY